MPVYQHDTHSVVLTLLFEQLLTVIGHQRTGNLPEL